MVTAKSELAEYCALCKKGRFSGFDYETTDLDPYTQRIVGFSLSHAPTYGIYVPIYHSLGECMSEADAKEVMVPFFNETDNIIAHNAGYEYKWTLLKWGVKIKFRACSQILVFLDDPNRVHRFDPRSVALKEVSAELFGYTDLIEYKDMVNPKAGQNLSYLPSKNVVEYGSQDSDLSVQIGYCLFDKICKEQGAIFRMEMELIPVVSKMTIRGIKENPAVFEEGSVQLEKELRDIEIEVFQEMGFTLMLDQNGNILNRPFDLGSSARVSDHLFGVMGLPTNEKPGKSGRQSAGKKALDGLRNDFPVVDKLLKWRKMEHMKNNFVKNLPTYINPVTGLVHGSFNQTGVPTGRFAHSDPNLAQLPKKRE